METEPEPGSDGMEAETAGETALTEEETEKKQAEKEKMEKERKLQEAVLSVKKKYGKNAMLKGMNLQEGATSIERNRQIGGHKARGNKICLKKKKHTNMMISSICHTMFL